MSRRLSHILDLFAEDSQLNVYAGELEVRPPGAPTIEWEQRLSAVGESSPYHLVSVTVAARNGAGERFQDSYAAITGS
jgi:hypothetical protein